MDRVIVFETNAMEDAYSEMISAAESRAVDAIVLDSYPALVADDEDAKDMDEATMASGARVTGKFFRKVGQATRRSLVEQERPLLALIVNQFRDQIGGWAPAGGTPKTSPGGKAKNYAYYTRLETSRTEWIDEKRPGGSMRVGQVIKVKTLKSKAAAPSKSPRFASISPTARRVSAQANTTSPRSSSPKASTTASFASTVVGTSTPNTSGTATEKWPLLCGKTSISSRSSAPM